MARPSPNILLRSITDSGLAVDVCSAEGIYAVYYCDRPMQLRTKANPEISYPNWKYQRTCFSTSGPAFNLARRLNRRFATDQFSVVRLSSVRTLKIPL